MNIKIDPEFKSLIPPLSADEYAGLEKSICEEGCRDALILWGDVLVDGHNRYEICQKHGIEFKTIQMAFENRGAAMLWIIDNQISRRNLPLVDRVLLEDKKKGFLAKKAAENIGGDKKSVAYQKSLARNLDNDTDPKSYRENKTDYKIAKAAGTSEDTVRKIRKIAESGDEQLMNQVRQNKLSVNQAVNSLYPKAENIAKKAVRQAKEEREAFKKKQADVVLEFSDVVADQTNRRLISRALLIDIHSMLEKVEDFGFLHTTQDLDAIADISKEDRKSVADRISKTISMLTDLKERMMR